MLSGDILHLAVDYSSFDIADDEQQEAEPFPKEVENDDEMEE